MYEYNILVIRILKSILYSRKDGDFEIYPNKEMVLLKLGKCIHKTTF